MTIIGMVEYVNKNGKITVKGFGTEESLNEFTSRLEQRGVEYLVTKL